MALDTNFAFEGFRVIKAKPMLIPIWGTVLLIFYAALFYVMFSMMMPAMTQMTSAMATGNSADPTAILAMYQKILPMYGIIIPVGLLFGAIMNCAVFRAVLRPSESGFGYLRFGGDELRQIGVNLLLFLIVIVAEVIVGIVIGVLVAVVGAAAPKALVFVAIIGIPLLICLIFWVVVRMSLYSVQTFDTRKINLFGSFALTKGNFWSLLGGYIIALIMAFVVEILAVIVYSVVMLVVGMTAHITAGAADPANPLGMFMSNPVLLVPLALFIVIVTPLMFAIMIAPVAAAYRQLAGKPGGLDTVFA